MKKRTTYSVTCSFSEAAPTLQEKMRLVLQNAVKERESVCLIRR